MSTSYYRLRRPFTSAKILKTGGHQVITLWINHAQCGSITVRNEELVDVLMSLKRDDQAVHVTGGDGECYVNSIDDLEPETTLIDEYGELMTYGELMEKHK